MSFVINTETLAAEGYIDGYYTYTVTDGEATIVDVDDGISGDVVIPSTLGGYPVVAIGGDALVSPFITSVTIPEGVTSIGEFAFAMCVKVKTITLPETLTEIDNGAFANCISLEEIILPEGVEILNDQIFYGCFSLERLVIKNSEIDMNKDEAPCYVNYKLKDITLTEFIERICEAYELYLAGDEEGCAELMGELSDKYVASLETPEPLPLLTIYSYDPSTAKTYAEENGIPFKNISELEDDDPIENDEDYYTYTVTDGKATIIDVDDSISGDVIIPSTLGGYPVVAIGDEAFYGCIYITSVTIPEGVTSIGKKSFAFCLRLKNIVLPESLKLIDNGAFVMCFLLEKIVIPENVDMINDAAFAECKSLKEIELPSSVQIIERGVFDLCTQMEKLIIPNPQCFIYDEIIEKCLWNNLCRKCCFSKSA